MFLSDQKGISLLQTIISMGLVGGLLLIVFQTSSIISGIGIQGAESTDLEIFLAELRKRISSTGACKNSLETGINIKDPAEGAVYDVEEIKRNSTINFYEKGSIEKFGKVNIDRISFEIPVGGLNDLGGDKYNINGNLRIRMKRKRGGHLDRIIPLDLSMDNSKTPLVDNIISCSAGLSNELETLMAACKLMNGTITSTEPFSCDSELSGGGIIWY